MCTQIKKVIESIWFKYVIIFLLAMVITVVLGLVFYDFLVMVIALLAGILGVFFPIVEIIADKIKYESPPFLENLPIKVKRGIIIFFYGILFGSLVVIFYVQKDGNSSSTTESNEEEIFQINVLNEVPANVNIGEIVSVDLNILTPESYKFETTPFILYSAYYDEEYRTWVQMGAFRISAGEENYSLNIDTKLLGLPQGSYMFAFDIFKSSDYAEGRSLSSARVILNLSGEKIYYTNDIFDRNVISYEKITDVFAIDGIAYSYDTEELVLNNVKNDDLEKISRCRNLKKLQIQGKELSDLNALQYMFSLESLFISSENLEDITPIGGLVNLKNLSIGGLQHNGIGFSGKLSDISPIENLKNLETLSIFDCQVEDIKAVQKLNKLTTLWIYKTAVKDITPLKKLIMIKDLRLHSNNISNITVLENLKELEYLTLTGNPIVEEQLTRLRGCLPNCEILYR